MAKKRSSKKGEQVTLSDDKVIAIDALERLIDKEFAVALRRVARKVHVRAVRDGAIIEVEANNIQEALNETFDKVFKKAESKASE